MLIYSENIYTHEGCKSGFLKIENGKFKEFIFKDSNLSADVDYGSMRIIPGIIDTHNHGAYGYRFDDVNEEEAKLCLKAQASVGVTGVFPTIVSVDQYKMYSKLSKEFQTGAQVLAIHSEGPWGARVGEKGINTGYPAVDMELARKMVKEAEDIKLLVDIAPEVEGALDAIKFFDESGVTVGIYHTNANYVEALKGIDQGISVSTHLFNVMTGLHHRDVGTAGASILRDDVYCELICDGLHVSLEMIELALRMKRHDRIMMVSDCGSYLGAPVGKYRSSSKNHDADRKEIFVTEEGFVVSKTGRITGSSKPVVYGIKNLVSKLGYDLSEVIKMTSLVPSEKYGLTSKGSICVDKDADFVVINEDYSVLATYVKGVKVFDSEEDCITFNPRMLKENWVE